MTSKAKIVLLIIAVLLIGVSIIIALHKYNPSVRQGELAFLRNDEVLKEIYIKAVETNEWRARQDLMFKDALPDSCGMLFIFEHDAIEPFHMSEKHLPIDLIAVAPNNKIVIIEKYIPASASQALPVNNKALYSYIIIVKAGFCNTYSITENDSVIFELK